MKAATVLAIILWVFGTGCKAQQTNQKVNPDITNEETIQNSMNGKLKKYKTIKLIADLSSLSDAEKQMIPLLIEASKIMDSLFWYEAYGDQESLLKTESDLETQQFIKINYGPWDRLENDQPFITGAGPKAKGANFYPVDMTLSEFDHADLVDKNSLYTFLRRDASGNLKVIPYHVQFAKQVNRTAQLLEDAAALAEAPGLKKYLQLRAEALRTDDYKESDLAWMDMKDNTLEVVIGPIETYEDQLLGAKAAHEAYVLIKDQDWSQRLAKYADFLPELQKGLPVQANYKKDKLGTNSDLNAYDVIYYAGHANAGSKTIAINLPNDEEVQTEKGTRRLQLKNAMQAKFDEVLIPIADVLIATDQRQHISFDAFFANTMFHEVAHGLGIKNTIDGKGTVRKALKEHASALEEGKADILGLYMITSLHGKGEIEGNLMDYYTTFMTSVFRSVRFGLSSAHGRANLIRFNFFKERGAIVRDQASGKYRIDFDKMQQAMDALAETILVLQGDGDYDGVQKLIDQYMVFGADLQADLDKLGELGIPRDIVFEQGLEVLGLE